MTLSKKIPRTHVELAEKSWNLSLRLDAPDCVSVSAPSGSTVHLLSSPSSSSTSRFCPPPSVSTSVLSTAPRLNAVVFSPSVPMAK